MRDLITVVVPIYNGEKYLRETIEGVLNQTYKNLEIFLIDDSSTDNSLKIAKYYEKVDKRVKVFTQNNLGISMTMKRAVMYSNGEYIARCDQDDINEPNRYEKQLKYLKENDYDMVGCYYKSFGNGNSTIKRNIEISVNRPIKYYFDQYRRYCDGICIYGGSIFSKLSVLKKFNPFHGKYVAMEDAYLYIILHKNGCKIGILDEVLYNYRVHKKNTSLNGSYREVSTPQYCDTLFSLWYEDKVNMYKNIVVIKRQEEEELIRNSFEKYFSNLNPKFVNEHSFDDFLENEILNYNPEDSLFFVGGMFFNKIFPILKNRNFKMYENLFFVIDCYWK